MRLFAPQPEDTIPAEAQVMVQRPHKPSKAQISLANSALTAGSSAAPAQSVGEALARALTGVAGGYFAGKAEKQQKEYDAGLAKAYAEALNQPNPGAYLTSQGFTDEGGDLTKVMAEAELKNKSALNLERQKTPILTDRARQQAEATFPFKKGVAAAGAPQIGFNIQDNFGKSFGKNIAGDVKWLNERAAAAQQQIPILQRALQADIYTGFAGETVDSVRKAFAGIGLDLGTADSAALKQAALSKVTELAAQFRPLSNEELRFIQTVVPSLGNTQQQNKQIIGNLLNQAQSSISRANTANQFTQQLSANPDLAPSYYQKVYGQYEQPNSPDSNQAQGIEGESTPVVRDDNDFNALQPGALFRDPQGNLRRKQ